MDLKRINLNLGQYNLPKKLSLAIWALRMCLSIVLLFYLGLVIKGKQGTMTPALDKTFIGEREAQ